MELEFLRLELHGKAKWRGKKSTWKSSIQNSISIILLILLSLHLVRSSPLFFFVGSSFAGSFLFCAWVPFFFCRFLSSSSPWVSFFFMFFLVRSSPLFFLGSSAGSFLFCAWIPFFFCRFLSSSSPWVSFFFVFFLFSWGLFFFFLCGSLCLLFFFNFRSSSILHIRL